MRYAVCGMGGLWLVDLGLAGYVLLLVPVWRD